METKKLTCCDLMIGDWVECNGKFIQVENVHKDMINYTPDIPYVQEEYFIEGKDITPIPLTAEILEKNGWTKPASGRIWSRNNVPSFVLEEIDDGSFEVTTDTCSEWGGLCMIRYVHHLQHALRLCGINDKEIVL